MTQESDRYKGFKVGAHVWLCDCEWDEPLPVVIESVELRTTDEGVVVAAGYKLLDEDGDKFPSSYDAYNVRETKREALILMMKMQQETIHEIETQLQDATDRLWKLNMTYDECIDEEVNKMLDNGELK